MDHERGVGEQRPDARGEPVEQRRRLGDLPSRPPGAPVERLAMQSDQVGEPLVPVGAVAQVAEAQSPTGGLVRVGRPDAAPRGPDLPLPEAGLLARLDLAVDRQDEVGAVREEQVGGRVEPGGLERPDLLEEGERVHDTPVPHDGPHSGVEDRRGKEMEHDRPAFHHDRVAGVVASAEADHGVEARGEEVHELPLPLVTPLGADDGEPGHGAFWTLFPGRSSRSRGGGTGPGSPRAIRDRGGPGLPARAVRECGRD